PPRSLVMGVVNVTPDSFSDGGRWAEPEHAIEHGRQLLAEGADLLDVGGESTRPGATRPVVAEEMGRVIPVISALAGEGAVVSVDTMRAEVADAALEAGAVLVNDVSGGLADPEILDVVAARGATYAAMHWRAHADTMQRHAEYDDVVDEVLKELASRVEAALSAGIDGDRLAIDPGLGFAKTAEHNWALLKSLEEFHGLGHALLVGSSRKTFLGRLLADDAGELRPVLDREDATTALTTLAAAAGAWCVRVHNVRANVDAVKVAARWAAG
ncbi:MAG TPA: dihydropteroate synthase, partial [Nocardioidaceae bacterium]|nr:dihydropteroate synthase [Nocardioidaceae bacterium]